MQCRIACQGLDGDAAGGGNGTGQIDAAAFNIDVGARNVPAGGFHRDGSRSRNLAAEIDVVGGDRHGSVGSDALEGGCTKQRLSDN